MDIKVIYTSVDYCRKTRTFKTVKGASKFAREWIGDHPIMGMGYAILDDGVGKIEANIDLKELFPGQSEGEELPFVPRNCCKDCGGLNDPYDPNTGAPCNEDCVGYTGKHKNDDRAWDKIMNDNSNVPF